MILIVTALFPPEPVVSANLSFDIANALAANKDVTVISPPPTRPYGVVFDTNSIPNENNFEHITLNTYTCPESKLIGRAKESYSLGVHTKKFIEDNYKKIELIYANTWPLFAQKYLAETASRYNIPLVLHVQDIYPESISEKIHFFGPLINRLLLPIDKKTLNLATKIITISDKMREYIINSRHLKKSKVLVVRNWQNDDIFLHYKEKKLKQEEKQFIFMYLGSINPTAKIDLLIHAFGKADLKDSILIIAGNGPDKERCIQIANLYRKNTIQFINVSSDDVPHVQAKANVLMLPLKKGVAKTALPSKLTAYMLSGKPIIAAIDKDSEPAQIISNNHCGIIVKPEDEDALIKGMRCFYNMDRSKLIKMGEKSFQYAKHHLTREHNLSKMIKIILDTLKEK